MFKVPITIINTDRFEFSFQKIKPGHWTGIENHGEDFKKLMVNKPAVGEQDVKIEMKFCGVCHSDVHFALNELAAGAGKEKLL